MKTAPSLKSTLAAAIAFGLGATCASAATITVGSLDDAFHSTACNLRNAVKSFRVGAAQGSCVPVGAFGNNDTVLFAPALANSTITLASGQIAIAGTVTISGSGQTIDADYGSRVMYVNNATLIASDLTLTRGYASGTDRDGNGGGLYVYNGNVTLDSVTVSHNYAIGDGGGINLQAGSLTLSHATVSGNTAMNSSAGGLSLYGTTTISDSAVTGNTGTRTGGIAVFSGYAGGGNGYNGSVVASNLTIARSTIADNHAACSTSPCTGGIYSDLGNFITIGESTISGNSAAGAFDHVAGGIYAYDSPLNIVNSTIAMNSATGNNDIAGALWQTGTGYGNSSVVNTTFSANTATSYNVGANVRSGVMLGYGGDSNLQLRNAIVAGNANGTDLGVDVSATHAGVTSCVLGTSADIAPFKNDATNRFSDTPGLGALQDNGGATQTMALQAGSIAIDAGKNTYVSTAYDQRGPGFARVFNGTVDIGAVEFQGDRIFANGFEPGP